MLGVVIMSVLLGTRALGQAPPASAQLALVGGTIYTSPTEPPIRDGAVLIDGGKIVSVGRRTSVRVPRGTTVIDTTGSTITAGFWNSHVHFLERMWANPATVPASDLTRQFQMMLTQYGFTSVFDIWSSWENTRQLRDRVESGDVAGPRIRATGPAMFPRAPGASAQMELSSAAGWAGMGFMPQEKIQLSRVAETAEAVAQRETAARPRGRRHQALRRLRWPEWAVDVREPDPVGGERGARPGQAGLRSSNDHRRADGVGARRCRRAGALDAAIGAME